MRKKIFQENLKLCPSSVIPDPPPGIFFSQVPAIKPGRLPRPLKVQVIGADCVETAAVLQAAGLKTALLNMANGYSPGGGVFHGAGAQEENLFRRSNLHRSLFPFHGALAETLGLPPSPHRYPILEKGIYSPGITFFRSSEATGYGLLAHPLVLDVVSIPALDHPPLRQDSQGLWTWTPKARKDTKKILENLLRICAHQEVEAPVLSALGCGAFGNPAQAMAALFREILESPEFSGLFTLVVFGIFDDRNSHHSTNPWGNLLPFQETFL